MTDLVQLTYWDETTQTEKDCYPVVDLNGKADTDLTNITDSAKVLMSGMGMPSNESIDLTLGASGSTYTAPADGWFVLGIRNVSSSVGYVSIQKRGGLVGMQCNGYSTNIENRVFCPVRKNDVVGIYYNGVSTVTKWVFVYAVGSESEAS